MFTSLAAKALAALVGAIALLTGGYLYGHHQESLVLAAYQEQVAATSARAVADAEQHNAKVRDVADQQQAVLVSQYQDKLNEIAKERDTAIASISAGRLWVGATHCHANAVSTTPGSTPGSHGATFSAELQPEIANALVNLAADADVCSARLAAAQKVINEDRVEINGGSSVKPLVLGE